MERRRQREGLALDGDLPLLHRLEQRGLGLGRRPVDLVGEQQPGEQRAAPELELRGPLVVEERPGQVGGQQVGGELGAREVEPERLGEGPRGQGLAEPGVVLEQHVALGEDRAEHQPQRLLLADDGLADLVEHPRGDGAGLLDGGHLGGARCGRHSSSILRTQRSIRSGSRRYGGSVSTRSSSGPSSSAARGSSSVEVVPRPQRLVGELAEPIPQRGVGLASREVALQDAQVRRRARVEPAQPALRLGVRRPDGGLDRRGCRPAAPTAHTTSATTSASRSSSAWPSMRSTAASIAANASTPPASAEPPPARAAHRATARLDAEAAVDGVERLERRPPVVVGHRVVGEAGLAVEVGQPGHRARVGADQVEHAEHELAGRLPRPAYDAAADRLLLEPVPAGHDRVARLAAPRAAPAARGRPPR